jgi:hypothetical protein
MPETLTVGMLRDVLANVDIPDEVEVWISDDTSENQELKPATETFFDPTADGDDRYFLLAHNPKQLK